VLLIISIHLASCSWITDFIISNNSNESIKLSYTYKPWKDKNNGSHICPEMVKVGFPEITLERNLKRANENWEKIESGNLTYDQSSCELSFVLIPGQSARITSMGTYTGHKEGSDAFFLIDRLSIKTNHGLLRFEGFELLKRFKKQSKTLYVLEYN